MPRLRGRQQNSFLVRDQHKGGSCAFRRCGGEVTPNTQSLYEVLPRAALKLEKGPGTKKAKPGGGEKKPAADLARAIGAMTEAATAERSKVRRGIAPKCRGSGS